VCRRGGRLLTRAPACAGLAEGRAAASTPGLSPAAAAAAAASARAAAAPASGTGGGAGAQPAAAPQPPAGGGGGGDGGGGGAAGQQPGRPAAGAGDGAAAKVERLVGLGFPRAQCEAMLAACGGDEERAASLLFDDAGGF